MDNNENNLLDLNEFVSRGKKSPAYTLITSGSALDGKVQKGDLLVIERNKSAKNGEIVIFEKNSKEFDIVRFTTQMQNGGVKIFGIVTHAIREIS